ncbi:hypothetical protein NDU88_002889 [Pleurodeles waltl]|uniref:Uncharacterized protein n=1 Tax=Pleurodeles waltl TaxID=8319 RepID=A0AAV7M5I8_PLEWA|nr:hypothetical protein NDU88_002889 [Pleurodeles waltl]
MQHAIRVLLRHGSLPRESGLQSCYLHGGCQSVSAACLAREVYHVSSAQGGCNACFYAPILSPVAVGLLRSPVSTPLQGQSRTKRLPRPFHEACKRLPGAMSFANRVACAPHSLSAGGASDCLAYPIMFAISALEPFTVTMSPPTQSARWKASVELLEIYFEALDIAADRKLQLLLYLGGADLHKISKIVADAGSPGSSILPIAKA